MDGYGKRILVVDANPECRTHLENQLGKEGYAVQSACDGLAGLDEMRKRRFDAVIADCHTPEFGGLEFAEYGRIVWPDVPVILLVADPDYFTDIRKECGAVSCIRKPYETAMLLSVLRTAIHTVSPDRGVIPMVQLNR